MLVTEKTKQARYEEKKAKERNDIIIPKATNEIKERRERLLQDPAEFLRYYMPDRFWSPFADYQKEMMDLIVDIARNGGDQAISAPRGDGKTEITKGITIFCILKQLIRFPVVIAASGKFASRIYDDIRSQFESNERLIEDFADICVPCVALGGTPQKAAKQTHNGEPTKIKWSTDECIFATIKDSPWSGVCMTYAGMDSAIRGINIRGNRPDFIIVDDPETRESAASDNQIETRNIILNRDIAGLADGRKRLSRVVLCTIQNRNCLAAMVTNPAVMPSWNGKRYAGVVSWPNATDLWETYIELRQTGQKDGDGVAKIATKFYLENREAMDEGAVVLNPERFSRAKTKDGWIIEHSAIQTIYNLISDNGLGYVQTEIQNDPQEDEPETMRLSAGVVASRMSGFARNELPKVETPLKIVFGVDLGKYQSYWTKLCVHGNAITHILDYGVIENHGMQATTPQETVERSLINRLHEWRIDILSQCSPDLVLIDSGTYTESVYGFCKQAGFPFMPAKGQPENFKFTGADTPTSRHFEEVRAEFQKDSRGWLYHINGVYWKNQVQQRIKTATFNEVNQLNEGSLSVFSSFDNKQHLSFSHHLVSEQYEETFTTGKGLQKKWVVKNRNNHWLDSTAYALAGTSILGFRIVPRVQPIPQHPQTKPVNRQPSRPQNFRQRKGGWIHGWRR
jgi:hypothetical protein